MFVHPSLSVAAEADWLGAQARKPVPSKPRGNPERDFQVEQVQWLREHLPTGSVVFAIGNESEAKAKTPKARARYQWRRIAAGVCPGFPDVGVALPDGRTLYIENKSRTGGLSKNQREVHAELRAGGHTVFVARTIEQTRAGLIAAGVALADVSAPHPVASNDAAKINTPGRLTVRARLGGSTFALPADKLPAGFRP